MTKLIDKIENIYLDKFHALPECEMKTKALHALNNETSFGWLGGDIADYLEDNLLSEEEHPFILDLLKTYDNRSSGSSLCNGEGGINIKSGWGL
jgi:hypothetical protein